MDFFGKQKDFDFVSVGDITTDAFIRLSDAKTNRDADGKKNELILRFGDKVPYEFMEEVRAVGNSANAAVCAARLGLSSSMVTNVGDDHNGHECIATLKKNGFTFLLLEKILWITTNKLRNI